MCRKRKNNTPDLTNSNNKIKSKLPHSKSQDALISKRKEITAIPMPSCPAEFSPHAYTNPKSAVNATTCPPPVAVQIKEDLGVRTRERCPQQQSCDADTPLPQEIWQTECSKRRMVGMNLPPPQTYAVVVCPSKCCVSSSRAVCST